jgi:hypothetical protein
MKESVTMLENLNTTDDLMLVYKGQMNKGEAFNKHIGALTQHFAQCGVEEQKRQAICQGIQQHGPQLAMLNSSNVSNPVAN